MKFWWPMNQTTRMIKLTAPCCGYLVRTSRKWIDEGLPVCHHGRPFIVDEDELASAEDPDRRAEAFEMIARLQGNLPAERARREAKLIAEGQAAFAALEAQKQERLAADLARAEARLAEAQANRPKLAAAVQRAKLSRDPGRIQEAKKESEKGRLALERHTKKVRELREAAQLPIVEVAPKPKLERFYDRPRMVTRTDKCTRCSAEFTHEVNINTSRWRELCFTCKPDKAAPKPPPEPEVIMTDASGIELTVQQRHLMTRPLLTVAEASLLLDLPTTTINRWVKDGLLAPVARKPKDPFECYRREDVLAVARSPKREPEVVPEVVPAEKTPAAQRRKDHIAKLLADAPPLNEEAKRAIRALNAASKPPPEPLKPTFQEPSS